MKSQPNSEASQYQHLSRSKEWLEKMQKDMTVIRRTYAIAILCAPFTTEQLENATSFEQLLRDTEVERNKLRK